MVLSAKLQYVLLSEAVYFKYLIIYYSF
jgi:hypothetical protein